MLVDPGIAIGLGIILSLFFTETLGVTAGGLIVPGYIAIYLNEPYMVIGTFSISIFTYFVVRFLSYFMLIYGKRRLVFALLLGFLFGLLTKHIDNYVDLLKYDFIVIGNIIPGLIANWMDRQGVLSTISTILIISSLINLILMVLGKYV